LQKTPIEWVKNPDSTQGYTWNPITGCLNHIDGLCKGGGFPCYAYRLANGRLRDRYLTNLNTAPVANPDSFQQANDALNDPFYPRFWSDRCNRIDMGPVGKPKGIFVCDMSDLFGIGIPEEWTHRVLDRCKDMPHHRFYLLTKQPQNLIKWSPFPSNCWVGVTATNQKAHNEAVVVLAYIEANTKFISHEPLLEHISLHSPYSPEGAYDWDILGAQTRPTLYPRIEWVEEVVEAADKADIPVFLKDNLKPLLKNDNGWTPGIFVDARDSNGNEWLRQELPER